MEELEITLGQRSLASIHGEQTTASAYAGLGARHLLLVGDGAAGAVPSRLAAQVACSSALARMRASVIPELAAQVDEAFAEANGAVRRALIGSPAEDKGGASLVMVVVDARGLTAARVGGGRVYLLRGERLEPLFREAGPGILGLGQSYPEVVEIREQLGGGDRVIVLSESAMRATGADLYHLVRGPPPQLAATRLADAARRRGQHDPIAVHVLEVESELARPDGTHHPAIARLARDRPKTFDTDGSVIGADARGSDRRERLDRAGRMASLRGRDAGLTGLAGWFVAALVAGVVVALVVSGGRGRTPASAVPEVTLVSYMTEVEVVDGPPDVFGEVVDDAAGVAEDPEITSLFEADTIQRLAKNLRNHVTKRYPERGDKVFEALEAAVMARRKEPMVVEALVELLKEPELKRTARWVQDLLPRLVSGDDDGAQPP